MISYYRIHVVYFPYESDGSPRVLAILTSQICKLVASDDTFISSRESLVEPAIRHAAGLHDGLAASLDGRYRRDLRAARNAAECAGRHTECLLGP